MFAALGTARSIDLDHPGDVSRSTLDQLGLTVEDLQSADLNGDHVIRGEAEFGALFDHLGTLDRRRPRRPRTDLGRAEEMFEALRQSGSSHLGPDVFTHGSITEGEGPDAREVAVYVQVPEEVRARAAAIRALPPPSNSGRGREPVAAYLEAIDAFEAGTRRPPEGVPGHVFDLTVGLSGRGITSEDAEHYLATGRLPDLFDADGAIRLTGAARFEALEQEAMEEGSWPAVYVLTFLVNMRRSAIASQSEALQADLDEIPKDHPERAALEAMLRDAAEFEDALRRGLSSIYTAATIAREQQAAEMILRASTVSEEAAEARASGDIHGAERLESEAARLRDEGARMAYAEAQYRASLQGTGWDASRAFDLAARAQIERGMAEVDAIAGSRRTVRTPPASLGTADDGGNGVPGAGRLLEESRAHSAGGSNHRTLSLEGARQRTIATFHRTQLEKSGYFDRVTMTSTPTVRSSVAVAHYEAYLEARASQADAAGRRLALFGDPTRLLGAEAIEAARVAGERRSILEELSGVLGQSVASDRAASQARERRDQLAEALTEAKERERDAGERVRSAEAGLSDARDRDYAVFGDTFKSEAAARRDDQGVADAERILEIERAQREFATVRADAVEDAHRDADADAGRATIQARRDRRDAGRVLAALERHAHLAPGGYENPRRGLAAVRVEADAMAVRQEAYLDRASAEPPEGDEVPVGIAALELDLAGYWTRSTDLHGRSVGRRRGAVERLDRAARFIVRADAARTARPLGEDGRTALARGLVEARAELAEVNAEYRNGVARDQLAAAEAVMRSDLSLEARQTAQGRIGQAAVNSLVRHDVRFDEVYSGGGYERDADDDLFRQAQRMLGPGADASSETFAARRTLRQIARSLSSAGEILEASERQLLNGHEYAAAQTRSMGRSEIAATQAKISSVARAGAYWVTLGHVDISQEKADATEQASNARMIDATDETARMINGARQLGTAWDTARRESRRFELLGGLRIMGGADDGTSRPTQYADARRLVHGLASVGYRGEGARDWSVFSRIAIREGQVPVASALRGPVLGLHGANEALGDRDVGVVTGSMREMMQDQAESLRETTDGMGWVIATNITIEFVGGLVLTGGLGSAVAAGEGANALNAGRTGLQAMSAVRAAGTATRGARASSILKTVGTTATVGAGMYGVSWGTRRLFGESSDVSRGVDVLVNIVPIGAGQRAAGLPQRLEGVAARVGRAERAAGRAAMSERLLARASFYAPQAAIGGAQIFTTTLATPLLAEQLGVRSEAGQAAIGVALGAVMAGGIAYGVTRSRRGRGTIAEHTARHLLETDEGENRPSTQREVRAAVDRFLRRTEGRMPSADELRGLRADLYRRLRIPEQGGGGAAVRRARADATVEALRMERAGALGMGEAFSTGRAVREADARRAVTLTAERLYASRLTEDPDASRVQAYRDAADVVSRSIEGGSPELRGRAQAAALDQARAIEIAEGFSVRRDGAEPLIRGPKQRAQVESIVASELGAMRRSVESGDGPPLTTRAQDGASLFERMGRRLRDEAGLSPQRAESVLRATQHAIVERAVEVRVARAQSEAAAPLDRPTIERIVAATAEQSGVEPARARQIAGDVVSRAGFEDWARSWLPPRHWTPAQHREHFLATADPATRTEVGQLSAVEFAALYPDGPVPSGLDEVGRIPGFAGFARRDPAGARLIADAATLFGGVHRNVAALVQRSGSAGFDRAVAEYRPMMPVVQAHPTNPDYVVVTRGPRSPSWMPAYNLRPRIALDHNGAFHQTARVPGRIHGERQVASPNLDFVVMRPDQLVVGGRSLSSMDGVMVFSGHGGRHGFAGLDTPEAARMAADQVRAARASGERIDYVVLDACHQRDRRFLFGRSNGEAFQAALDRELGGARVQVLAAARGGPTYVRTQPTYLPLHWDQGHVRFGYGEQATRYVEADHGRLYVSMQDWLIAGSVAGVAAEGAVLYYAVGELSGQRQREELPDRRQPVTP